MSKFLRNKSFSNLRRNEIVGIIEEKGYVCWRGLESETGMRKKKLRDLLRNNTLCYSLNSKRKFFTLRSVMLKNRTHDSVIWENDGKVFSAVGSLKETVLRIVRYAPDGIDEKKLTEVLKTPTKNVLRELKQEKNVKAVAFEGRQVFFATAQKRFSKQFQRRLKEENCEEIQISFEEFLKTLSPEIRHIAYEFVPEELQKEDRVNYKEFTKLLLIQPKIAHNSDRHMATTAAKQQSYETND